MKVNNPFFVKGYHGTEFFCDRQKETKKLLLAIENGRDITLMAPRRYGKTGLIHNVFAQLDERYVPVYLDIFQLRNLTEFTKAFSGYVVSRLSTPLEKTGRGILDFFRSCRPTMTPQTDGSVSFSFDIVANQAEATLKDVFSFLESRKVIPVVAIDEFQQVREFPESGVEALLRSHIQFCSNARFIFAGSKKHLMEEMFALPRGPFYQSTQLMSLEVIAEAAYAQFAQDFFIRAKRKFDAETFGRLYQRFGGITWYVQVVLNRVWENTEGLTDDRVVEAAIDDLVEEGSSTYSDLLRSQTDAAQRVLRAIAGEGIAAEVSSQEMIARHNLPAPSTVRSVVADLTKRDLLYHDHDGYVVYDRLFGIWLSRLGG